MIDPLFWLGLSLLLVSFSLFAVLLVTIPTLQEVAKAARSAEKLFDTLNREFPPTLEAIRMTGKEVGELTDELNQGINNATGVVKQVDRGLINAKIQAQQVQRSSRGLVAGVQAAWKTWRNPEDVVASAVSSPRRNKSQLPLSKQNSKIIK
jgi:hypothetical protein